MLLEPNSLDFTFGWLHGSAQGPLGIGALLVLVVLFFSIRPMTTTFEAAARGNRLVGGRGWA